MVNHLLYTDFEKRAHENPLAIAIVYNNEFMTYQQLNAKANQLAHFLLSQSLPSEPIIGLHFSHSFEQIISLLAVLKTGGAYLPLDTSYPKERLQFILQDSKADFLLTENINCDLDLPTNKKRVFSSIYLDGYPTENPPIEISETQLCYVIYTSGSTGKPKGVMIEHRNAFNTILQMNDIFPLQTNDSMLLNTPLGFDPSVWQIFWPLSQGSKIILSDVAQDPTNFIQIIQKYNLTIFHAGPTLFRMLFNQPGIINCGSLKLIIGGGEAWKISDLVLLKNKLPNCELCNVYGPTEASIHATFWLSENKDYYNLDEVPIGNVIKDMQAFILDEEMHEVSCGTVGQLYLSGKGVARGYLNDPELTKQKFIAWEKCLYDKRIYKTGDLAKVNAQGDLIFKGRADNQIKLRGFRIELGEIESAILKTGIVEQVCVLSYQANADMQKIAAFVVLTTPSSDAETKIRGALKETLPAYMIPSEIVMIDNLPMTTNQKVDKDLLVRLVQNEKRISSENQNLIQSSQSSLKDTLSRLWCEQLNLASVDDDQNFFDLGGDSLSGLDLIAKINLALGIQLNVTTLFTHQTINSLITHIETINVEKSLQPGPVKLDSKQSQSHWPLSDNQKWLLRMAKNSNTINNIVIPFRIDESVDLLMMQQAVANLVKNHDILHINIFEHNGKMVFSMSEKPLNCFSYEDLSGLSQENQQEALQSYYHKLNEQAIDLATDSLFGITLLKCSDSLYHLYIFMHHLISDPTSGFLVLKHLMDEYHSLRVKTSYTLKATSFVDYVTHEINQKNKPEYQNNFQKWCHKLKIPLCVNFGEILDTDLEGGYYEAIINEDISRDIKLFSKNRSITPFITLLCIFKQTLYQLYRQHQFGIGINVSRRDNTRWFDMIGPLSEQSVSIINFNEVKHFEDLILITTENIHDIYKLAVSLESIYQNLYSDRDNANIFNVLFDYEKVNSDQLLNSINVRLLPVRSSLLVRRHLSVRVADFDNYLKLQIRYRKSLFNLETIVNIAKRFTEIATSLTQSVDVSIA